MKENERMVLDEVSGLVFLKAMIDGKVDVPPMALTVPIAIVSVAPGSVRFTGTAGKQHLNPMGGVHGGFAATVLDTVTGCAVHTLLEAGTKYTTVDLNVKMLKPVPLDRELTATGKIIHKSGRLAASVGELKDGDGRLLAHATATCMIL